MEKYLHKVGIERVEESNVEGTSISRFTLSPLNMCLFKAPLTPSPFSSLLFGGVYYSYGEVFPVSTALIILSFV